MISMYVSIDETGRIGATTDRADYSEGMARFDFPDDFDFSKQGEYRLVDGDLIQDPLPEASDAKIEALKSRLYETDYVVIKVYESMVTGDALPEEEAARYAEIISQRQEWRAQINELETSLEGGE